MTAIGISMLWTTVTVSPLASVARTAAVVEGSDRSRRPSTWTVARLPGGRIPAGTVTTGIGTTDGVGPSDGVSTGLVMGTLGAGDTSTASHGALSSPLPTATPTERMPTSTSA